jgi:hypothetical protein
MANLIWSSNFDTASTVGHVFDLYAGGGPYCIVTDKVHSGTKSLYYEYGATGVGPNAGSRDGTDATNPAAADLGSLAEIYLRFWWWIPTGFGTGGAGGGRHTFRITHRGPGNYNDNGQIDTGVGASAQSFDIDLFDGNTPILYEDTTHHGLGDLPLAQWFKFELHANVGTKGNADGFLKVWVNGTNWVNDTNLKFMANPSVLYPGYDTFLAATNYESGTSTYWWMDDIEIYDGDPGAGPSGSTSLPFLPDDFQLPKRHRRIIQHHSMNLLESTLSRLDYPVIPEPQTPSILMPQILL